jgi:RNA polymerase sigma-70 factor, ECF subfamily
MPSPQDADLVARILQGETACFEEIVKRYETPLYSMAYRMTLDREAARDMTQDTFVAAYRSLPGYRGSGLLSSWLYSILSNRCITYLKRVKKIIFHDIDSLAEREKEDRRRGEEPQEACLTGERKQRLYEALAGLTNDQRLACTLFYLAGRSYQETAQILGISESKLKSDLFRARQNLRRSMSDLWTE